MQVTPINAAEAIVEPFCDPELSGLAEWSVETAVDSAAEITQQGLAVTVEWERTAADDPVLELERDVDIACDRYDRVLLTAVVPTNCRFRIDLETDAGPIEHETEPSDGRRHEYAVPIDGAGRIHRFEIALLAPSGPGVSRLRWIGLQSTRRLDDHLAQWSGIDPAWPKHLKPPEYEPAFEPQRGLAFDAGDVPQIRERLGASTDADEDRSRVRAQAEAIDEAPEERIHEFLPGPDHERFSRERSDGDRLFDGQPNPAVKTAVAGILCEDADLLRLAARYALSIARCDYWTEGPITQLPGSSWEHRCFVAAMACQEVATVLDLAGDLFTDAGRSFLHRRLAEHGIGFITYNAMKYDYVFENNQLSLFSHGRLAGLCALESVWPRVERHTEIAYGDLCESLDTIVLGDGGFVEGPGYFGGTFRKAGRALLYYATTRDEPLATVTPDAVATTAAYVEAIASTDETQDAIPICDGDPSLSMDALAFVAGLRPDHPCTRVLAEKLNATEGGVETWFSAVLLERLPTPLDPPPLSAFVHLPETGLVSSLRHVDDEPVKLFLKGVPGGAGHNHEDAGSFVLEFAGETFATDMGMGDYAAAGSELLKRCQYHNMLVPEGTAERPHPANPPEADVTPAGEGDERTVEASIDAGTPWDAYEHWERRWSSSSPERLTITDSWTLREDGPGRVGFRWHTEQAVERIDGGVRLTGQRGTVEIEAPDGATVSIDPVTVADRSATRITFGYDRSSGEATVTVTLQTTSDQAAE